MDDAYTLMFTTISVLLVFIALVLWLGNRNPGLPAFPYRIRDWQPMMMGLFVVLLALGQIVQMLDKGISVPGLVLVALALFFFARGCWSARRPFVEANEEGITLLQRGSFGPFSPRHYRWNEIAAYSRSWTTPGLVLFLEDGGTAVIEYGSLFGVGALKPLEAALTKQGVTQRNA